MSSSSVLTTGRLCCSNNREALKTAALGGGSRFFLPMQRCRLKVSSPPHLISMGHRFCERRKSPVGAWLARDWPLNPAHHLLTNHPPPNAAKISDLPYKFYRILRHSHLSPIAKVPHFQGSGTKRDKTHPPTPTRRRARPGTRQPSGCRRPSPGPELLARLTRVRRPAQCRGRQQLQLHAGRPPAKTAQRREQRRLGNGHASRQSGKRGRLMEWIQDPTRTTPGATSGRRSRLYPTQTGGVGFSHC